MKIEISPDEAVMMLTLIKAVEFPNEAVIPMPEKPGKDNAMDMLRQIFGDAFDD